MHGQHPTGYAQTPTQRATSDTTQNVNRDWTCQRWFNNIADKVSTKTHQYIGKFVAVVTLPFTFIPSLACDLFHCAKSLYQRTVSKAAVLNHVSTGSTSSSTSESNTSPTIDQLRQKFPVLDDYITARETKMEEVMQQLSCALNNLHNVELQLKSTTKVCNEKDQLLLRADEAIEELKCHKNCVIDDSTYQKKRIKELERSVDELNIENNHLKSCLCQFQDTKPYPGLDPTEEDHWKTSDGSSTATSAVSQSKPIIVVEELDDSATGKGTETDYIDRVSTKELTAYNSEAVDESTVGTESCGTYVTPNATSETSSDASFETIPLPLPNTPEDTSTPQQPELLEPLNPESPLQQNSPQVD